MIETIKNLKKYKAKHKMTNQALSRELANEGIDLTEATLSNWFSNRSTPLKIYPPLIDKFLEVHDESR